MENELIQLEKKYWQAMKDNDTETAVSLTKFPCIISGPTGTRRITEEEYRKLMTKNNAEAFKKSEIGKFDVEMINENTALVSYPIKVNGMYMLDVSTWVQDDGKWLCAFHSENPLRQ